MNTKSRAIAVAVLVALMGLPTGCAVPLEGEVHSIADTDPLPEHVHHERLAHLLANDMYGDAVPPNVLDDERAEEHIAWIASGLAAVVEAHNLLGRDVIELDESVRVEAERLWPVMNGEYQQCFAADDAEACIDPTQAAAVEQEGGTALFIIAWVVGQKLIEDASHDPEVIENINEAMRRLEETRERRRNIDLGTQTQANTARALQLLQRSKQMRANR